MFQRPRPFEPSWLPMLPRRITPPRADTSVDILAAAERITAVTSPATRQADIGSAETRPPVVMSEQACLLEGVGRGSMRGPPNSRWRLPEVRRSLTPAADTPAADTQ